MAGKMDGRSVGLDEISLNRIELRAVRTGRKTQIRLPMAIWPQQLAKVKGDGGERLYAYPSPQGPLECPLSQIAELCDYGRPGERLCVRNHPNLPLEIVAVNVQRIQDISEADIAADIPIWPSGCTDRRMAYRLYWDGLKMGMPKRDRPVPPAGESKRPPSQAWDDNPFVWVLDFRLIVGGVRLAT